MSVIRPELIDSFCDGTPAHGIFSVRCFGATGDGATDDSHAVHAACNAVNAAGGGVLFFPQGTFVVSRTIDLGRNTTVLGTGGGSVLKAAAGVTAFNMLLARNVDDVRVRDLVLDGNRSATVPPLDADGENTGCGFLSQSPGARQTGLSLKNVIARHHHGCGIRVTGASPEDDARRNPNEVEVIGCRVSDCGSRGVIVTRATRARLAGNVVTACTQAGIQLVASRAAVIDGNVVERTSRRPDTNGGHGITVANCFEYIIVNNVASDNERWGIVASGGVGMGPPMSQRYVVSNNVCRNNAAGGITVDPTTADDPGAIQDSFATVAANVCALNGGHGIHATHAGYVAVRGNICDRNASAGVAVNSSRHAVVAENVVTGNGTYGIAFGANPAVQGVGGHLLGGNVCVGNAHGDIQFQADHPPVHELHDRWPSGAAAGLNLPVRTTTGDPGNPVEGVLYLNTADNKLRLYADGSWRTLQGTAGQSW